MMVTAVTLWRPNKSMCHQGESSVGEVWVQHPCGSCPFLHPSTAFEAQYSVPDQVDDCTVSLFKATFGSGSTEYRKEQTDMSHYQAGVFQ